MTETIAPSAELQAWQATQAFVDFAETLLTEHVSPGKGTTSSTRISWESLNAQNDRLYFLLEYIDGYLDRAMLDFHSNSPGHDDLRNSNRDYTPSNGYVDSYVFSRSHHNGYALIRYSTNDLTPDLHDLNFPVIGHWQLKGMALVNELQSLQRLFSLHGDVGMHINSGVPYDQINPKWRFTRLASGIGNALFARRFKPGGPTTK